MDPDDAKRRREEEAAIIMLLMLLVVLLGLCGLMFYLLKWLLGIPGRIWSWLWGGSTEGTVKESADERRSWYPEGAFNEPAAINLRVPWSWPQGGSTVGAINKPAAERKPWCLHPHQLELWYNENIQRGTTDFDTDCREAVDTVVRYLHRVCSTNKDLFDVSKVVKGGSLGKGTMVKDLSDVDLVVFINPPHMTSLGSTDPQLYRDKLKTVLKELAAALRRHPLVRFKRSDAYLVNFAVEVRSGATDLSLRSVDVDLLPTADNISGHKYSLGLLFKEMLQMRNYDSGFYSASLVELQRDFVKNQPGYVKELIRLVKYWAYTCLPQHLRKSYPLELITIHRWGNAWSPSHFQKVQGLRDVLETLTDLNRLRTYWVEHYDGTLAKRSIEKLGLQNPIVLDPANPTNNACWAYQRSSNREQIQGAARKTLRSPLLRDVVVTSNWGGC
ncbi:2'-5'-oligoadenylate synthase 1-like [Patiria miniata]|uniref:2'-5' oligoadenylate synthase n=1 Tax=Patiria miniata TaxID=46514 RepID=A0A914BK56_PATMI|nr:2'-5'-oligoadenylate synthase 1-like [Patiria miniata]